MDVPSETPAQTLPDKAVVTKISKRLIPFLFLLYIVAYLDRANVGFAKLEMSHLAWFADPRKDVFGLGSGIFFIGYFLFEVPSNLLLQKVGARWWIARIMITWGIIASAMMFCNSAALFYTLRFLLGIAEAGFFPGIILYLTYWFTARERAHIIAVFMTATALANAFGGPISGGLLSLHLPGLANWQWMFLLEGIPAMILAFVVLAYLPDGPRRAAWLTPQEQEWAASRISEEDRRKALRGHGNIRAAFSMPGIWLLCLIYFTINMSSYGVVFWLPTLIKQTGVTSPFVVGLLTAGPYALAAAFMVLNGRHSDHTHERRLHVAGPLLVTSFGLALSAFQTETLPAMLAITIVLVGISAPLGPFWSLPTELLGGTAVAAGIAFINSVGNLGGFAGPALIGWIQGRPQRISYHLSAIPGGRQLVGWILWRHPGDKVLGIRYALLTLSCVALAGCIVALLARRHVQHAPDDSGAVPSVS
ncbi:MAG TPA: MFS transporter [Chthonomonadaceae bacterium]|nr:MFS transporter [Chthonomonadaceae bacterium]